MKRQLRALWDGLVLRCPRCHRGRLFRSWFTIEPRCAVCGLVFERATGELTGGMGVSIAVTLLLVVIASFVIGFSGLPIGPALVAMSVAIIAFVIWFYPVSRALWVALSYLTGAGQEAD